MQPNRPKLIVSPRGNRPGSALRRAYMNSNRRSLSCKTPVVPVKRYCQGLRTPRSAEASNQRSNIKVVVRVRPFANHENSNFPVVQAVDTKMVVFDPKVTEMDFFFHGVKQKSVNQTRRQNRDVKFVFDRVYDESATNASIYDDTIKPTIDTILSGYNCSVFAYGATGSGKTYTMIGTEASPGLTFLTVMELYERLKDMADDYLTEISISYLEVYNETVRDLLATEDIGPLNICEDAHGLNVKDLSTHRPIDADQLLSMLEFGNQRRSQHPTDHNAESSRSHAVFQVMISLRSRFTDFNNNYKSAKLVMVDLAGSERGTATGFKGTRFREGANINKSLLALGNCINALADGKKHIPYRDSKLTRILKDSLGGNCKTVMIANVSPSNHQYDDTYNTLRYANRAKAIKVQAKMNLLTVKAQIAQYGQIVDEMNAKIDTLTAELAEARAVSTCPSYLKFLAQEEEAAARSDTMDSPEIARPPSASLVHLLNPDEPLDHVDVTDQELAEGEVTIADRRNVERAYWETMVAVREAEWKVKARELRLESANRVESKDPAVVKGIERMGRQIDQLRVRSGRLVNKSEDLKSRVEEQAVKMRELITTAPQHLSAYLRIRSLEVENEMLQLRESFRERQCNILFEEGLKAESLLGRSMKLMKPFFQILRHIGHATTQHKADYSELVNEFLGTRLQFAEETERLGEETFSLTSAGHLNDTFSVSSNGNGPGDDTFSVTCTTSSSSNMNDTFSVTMNGNTRPRRFRSPPATPTIM